MLGWVASGSSRFERRLGTALKDLYQPFNRIPFFFSFHTSFIYKTFLTFFFYFPKFFILFSSERPLVLPPVSYLVVDCIRSYSLMYLLDRLLLTQLLDVCRHSYLYYYILQLLYTCSIPCCVILQRHVSDYIHLTSTYTQWHGCFKLPICSSFIYPSIFVWIFFYIYSSFKNL